MCSHAAETATRPGAMPVRETAAAAVRMHLRQHGRRRSFVAAAVSVTIEGGKERPCREAPALAPASPKHKGCELRFHQAKLLVFRNGVSIIYNFSTVHEIRAHWEVLLAPFCAEAQLGFG